MPRRPTSRSTLCRVCAVSTSGYFDWAGRMVGGEGVDVREHLAGVRQLELSRARVAREMENVDCATRRVLAGVVDDRHLYIGPDGIAPGREIAPPLAHVVHLVMRYFAGGIDATSTAHAEVYRYNPTTNTWATVASLPDVRWGAGTTVYNGSAVIAGCAFTSNTGIGDSTPFLKLRRP